MDIRPALGPVFLFSAASTVQYACATKVDILLIAIFFFCQKKKRAALTADVSLLLCLLFFFIAQL